MKNILARGFSFLLVFVFVASPVWATCGGGGGGGGGGMSGGGGGTSDVVYHVPWKMPMKQTDTPPTTGIVLYYFPASADELKTTSLRESRDLSLYASQCVSMYLADGRTPKSDDLIGGAPLPVVVLANPDSSVITRINNKNGKMAVADVEKAVGGEVKTRKTNVEASMKDAKAKEASDKAGAIAIYQQVVAQKCMFPDKAKDASNALKKLGAENIGEVSFPEPNFDPAVTASIMSVMKKGLVAEEAGRYKDAEQYYTRANKIDPADPTPLRYLGELNRHDTGNWIKARAEFGQILKMPADPLSRAVAMHGLGKITIHDGEFKKGLHLMEDSIAEYPLSLTYRNLAVYWNSEGDLTQANAYTEKAIALDPDDAYNVVFGAVFMAASGKKDEAVKIALAHMDLLPASYNLAAIFAQAGQRDKALELLKRHFYEYERYDQVRAKEMMEARVDAVFNSIRFDKDFVALTKNADGLLPLPMAKPTVQQGMEP